MQLAHAQAVKTVFILLVTKIFALIIKQILNLTNKKMNSLMLLRVLIANLCINKLGESLEVLD